MLDQNTDRMWYVIGAVLIGAAIILIANGSMPQLFANTGEGMQNVLTNSLEVVDGYGGNLLGEYVIYLRRAIT